jgi:hypothetical protein
MEKGILSVTGLRSDIQAIEREASLFVLTNFAGRSEAIDFLDFHIIDRISGLLQYGGREGELELLLAQAVRIKDELEKIDRCLFERIRGEIATGMFAGAFFGEMIRRLCGAGGTHGHDETGYDQLDAFVNGLFSDRPLPVETIALMPDMVSFHKTPVRVVFELVQLAEMGSEDLFFDIGSGLGQVVLLVNLISGARARGIEFEPAYSAYASAVASRLHLTDTDFINADAREIDYSKGTVFFLYTPFEGNMLRDVLRLLRTASGGRAIRIFTYGPCSSQVAAENWLSCVHGMPDDPYALCVFANLNQAPGSGQPVSDNGQWAGCLPNATH